MHFGVGKILKIIVTKITLYMLYLVLNAGSEKFKGKWHSSFFVSCPAPLCIHCFFCSSYPVIFNGSFVIFCQTGQLLRKATVLIMRVILQCGWLHCPDFCVSSDFSHVFSVIPGLFKRKEVESTSVRNSVFKGK